jgi:hypothetical protein
LFHFICMQVHKTSDEMDSIFKLCFQPIKTAQFSSCRISSQTSIRPLLITTVLARTTITMAPLATSSRALLRLVPRTPLPIARCLSTTTSTQRASATSEVHPSSSFDSPFKGVGNRDSTKIPDFSHYKTKSGSNSNLVFQYFMVGTMGALTAAGAKATVQGT